VWNTDGRSRVNNKGYIYIRIPEHPMATSTGYVYEHRVVMENKLGRLLKSTEVVHHIDGNRRNNAIDNLELLTADEHARVHALQKKKFIIKLACPECGSIFYRQKGKTFLCKPSKFNATFCSNRCRGRFSRRVQCIGMTEKAAEALRNCLLEVVEVPPGTSIDSFCSSLAVGTKNKARETA